MLIKISTLYLKEVTYVSRKRTQKLYERLKAQYPQYQLEFSGDSLILKRLYCKVEVNQSGVKIYVNGNLYDQFTSEYVDDLDDLYELIEAFYWIFSTQA